MKTKVVLFLIIIVSSIFSVSCKKNNRKADAEKIVREWSGKTIIIPSGIVQSYLGKDTVMQMPDTPFKILIYTDSVGCTSCKLKLYSWKQLIHEADSVMPGQVNFLFYFHPKNGDELFYLLKRDNFGYPVYIDYENLLDKQNKFPSEMEYQCFLLDRDNKVISIGNPVLNTKIWELYKGIITGKAEEVQRTTTINLSQTEIEMPNLKLGEKSLATFIIKNTGNQPLIIKHIDAACGCTVPSWEKRPVNPDEETQVTVEIRPDNIGYFHKTVSVHCNIAERVINLVIKGAVK